MLGKKSFCLLVILIIALFVAFYLLTGYLAKRFYPLYVDTEEIIRNNAQEYSIEASLISAIIYEESKFDPDVISEQGAIGLMQILPETAEVIAKEKGISDPLKKELYEPEINIEFGTYYFKTLLDRYGGDRDLALAAYNAGHGKVEKVGRDISKLPEETQNFIARVNKTEKMYQYLYKEQLNSEESDLSWFEIVGLTWGKIFH